MVSPKANKSDQFLPIQNRCRFRAGAVYVDLDSGREYTAKEPDKYGGPQFEGVSGWDIEELPLDTLMPKTRESDPAEPEAVETEKAKKDDVETERAGRPAKIEADFAKWKEEDAAEQAGRFAVRPLDETVPKPAPVSNVARSGARPLAVAEKRTTPPKKPCESKYGADRADPNPATTDLAQLEQRLTKMHTLATDTTGYMTPMPRGLIRLLDPDAAWLLGFLIDWQLTRGFIKATGAHANEGKVYLFIADLERRTRLTPKMQRRLFDVLEKKVRPKRGCDAPEPHPDRFISTEMDPSCRKRWITIHYDTIERLLRDLGPLERESDPDPNGAGC